MQASERRPATARRPLLASVLVLALVVGIVGMPAAAYAAPSPPTNLRVSPGKGPGEVKLSWSPPAAPGGGVTGYLIEVATDWDGSTGTFVHAREIKRSSRQSVTVTCGADLEAAPPETCAYRIRAQNGAGTSDPSEAVENEWDKPSHARKLRVRSTNFTDVEVTWNPPATTGGLPMLYDVFVSPDRGAEWTQLASDLTTTSYFAPGSCTSTVSCSYRVVAKNGIGEGPSSKPRHLKAKPAKVRKLSLVKTDDDPATGASSFSLSWFEPRRGLYDEGYQIEMCPGVCVRSSPGWAPYAAVPDGQLSTTATCSGGLVSCSFRVRAINRFGGEGRWIYRQFRPTAPYAVSATPGSPGTVDVSFYGPDAIGIAGMGGTFRFWLCPDDCDDAGNWALHSGDLEYVTAIPPRTVNLPCPSGSCMVRVQFARSDLASSMLSAASGTTAVEDVPEPIADLVAEPGDTSGTIDLSWAAPSSTPAITDYEYRVRVDAGSFGPWTPTGSTIPTFTHTGCPTGSACTYEVRAVNAIGAGSASNEATAMPVDVPAAITDLTAVPSSTTSGAVVLDWSTAPANPAVTNYEFRVRVDDGSFGSWTSIGSTSTSFVDTGCGAGNTCTYEVRGVNLLGPGAPSNQASATAVQITSGTPPQVSGFTVVTGSVAGTVDLSWDPLFTDPPVTHYEYRVRIGGGGFSEWISTGSTDPFLTFFCGSGVTCNFQVRAVNALGAGNASPNRGAVGAA
jgi:hypothetical protein